MGGGGGCVAAASDYWELESGCGIGIGKEMLLFAIRRMEIRNTKIREHGIVTGSVLGHCDLLRRGVWRESCNESLATGEIAKVIVLPAAPNGLMGAYDCLSILSISMKIPIITLYQTSRSLQNKRDNCVAMTEPFQYLDSYIARH